jgi:hypothetical protein
MDLEPFVEFLFWHGSGAGNIEGDWRRRLPDPFVAFRSAKGDFTLTPAHVTRATGNLNQSAICKVKAMRSAHTFDVAEIISWRQTLAATALVADDLMTSASTDRIIPCSETDLCLTQEQSLQPK